MMGNDDARTVLVEAGAEAIRDEQRRAIMDPANPLYEGVTKTTLFIDKADALAAPVLDAFLSEPQVLLDYMVQRGLIVQVGQFIQDESGIDFNDSLDPIRETVGMDEEGNWLYDDDAWQPLYRLVAPR